MEPVTATIGIVVSYLAKTLADSQSFKNFTDEFSEGVVNWIKPLFLRDDETPKDVLKDLQDDPKNPSAQKIANAVIEANINQNSIELLNEMVKVIKSKEANGEQVSINITHSEKFIVNSQIHGSVYFGDNNDEKQ